MDDPQTCDVCPGGRHDKETHRGIMLARFHLEDLQAAVSGEAAPWWWLSFADPELPKGSQFLGVSIVQCHIGELAPSEAWTQGCNPGGQVQIYQWNSPPPESDRNVLMDRQTLFERGYIDSPNP